MKLSEGVVVAVAAVAVVVVEPQTSRPFAWQTRNAKLAFTSKPLTYFVGGKHSIYPFIHSPVYPLTLDLCGTTSLGRHLIKTTTTTMPDPPPPSSAAARRPPQQQQQQQQRAGNLLGNANSQMLDSIVSGTNCEAISVVAQSRRHY